MVALTLSLRWHRSVSPDPPSSPQESSDIEEAEPHPRQRALNELPPPPSPSLGPPASPTSPSNSSTSQRPFYPFGFVIFLDPTSKRAQQLFTDRITAASETSPLVTKDIAKATHVIVGTSTFGDSFAREQRARLEGTDATGGGLGRAPFLVNLGWLEKSMRTSIWQIEEEYLFVSTGGDVVEKRGGLETVPEEMSSEDEESLARFIAALDCIDDDPSTKDEDGMDCFDRYLVEIESNERSANELRRHYELRGESFFEHRIWVLRREAAVLEPYSRTQRRKIKTRRVAIPSDQRMDATSSNIASPSTLTTTSNPLPTTTSIYRKRPLPHPTSSSSSKKVRFEDSVASTSISNPFQRKAPPPTHSSSSAPHRGHLQEFAVNLPQLALSKTSPSLSPSLSRARQLELATDRSSLGSSSLSCFFCWEDLAPFYSILDLAERSLVDMNEFVRIPGGKQACSSCLDWFEGSLRMLEEGDKEGMGELERMAWATERLMELGREERRRFVGVI